MGYPNTPGCTCPQCRSLAGGPAGIANPPSPEEEAAAVEYIRKAVEEGRITPQQTGPRWPRTMSAPVVDPAHPLPEWPGAPLPYPQDPVTPLVMPVPSYGPGEPFELKAAPGEFFLDASDAVEIERLRAALQFILDATKARREGNIPSAERDLTFAQKTLSEIAEIARAALGEEP